MNWPRLIALTLTAASLATAGATLAGGSAKQASGKPDKAALIARGEYLVTIGGCNDCHTPGYFYADPDWSRRLSGSEIGWQGPWGVSYARNLTPDKETGIGKWSEEDIVNTLRTGVRPDGSQLLPPMPWMNMVTMPDEDLFAVAAYLKSLPAVSHKNPTALKPGEPVAGSVIVFPPPTAWDAPRSAAGAAGGGSGGSK